MFISVACFQSFSPNWIQAFSAAPFTKRSHKSVAPDERMRSMCFPLCVSWEREEVGSLSDPGRSYVFVHMQMYTCGLIQQMQPGCCVISHLGLGAALHIDRKIHFQLQMYHTSRNNFHTALYFGGFTQNQRVTASDGVWNSGVNGWWGNKITSFMSWMFKEEEETGRISSHIWGLETSACS